MKLQILAKLRGPRTSWKYILIIVILVFVIGEGILMWQWWGIREETKIPEKGKSVQLEEELLQQTISGKRMLLEQERWKELRIRPMEIGNEFNDDLPNMTVPYLNAAKGISMQIPYNPQWGSEKYTIPPYYEYQESIEFGPIVFIGMGETATRACYMEFLPARSIEEAKVALQELEEKEGDPTGGVKKGSITVEAFNNIYLIKYVMHYPIIASIPEVEIIGKKHNYHLSCYGIDNVEEIYHKILETIQLIE